LTFKSKEYWEERYSKGGNSGMGSYGSSASLKASVINTIIDKHSIKTINDYGHGDGNNITLLKGNFKYYGYDVSKSAYDICTLKFKDNKAYTFYHTDKQFKQADLALSLDVLYHLVEYDVYQDYLNRLFSKSTFVLIYAQDFDGDVNSHCRSRKFTTYIKNTFPAFTHIDTIDGSHDKVKFYLYKK